jgi:hypothetical protein
MSTTNKVSLSATLSDLIEVKRLVVAEYDREGYSANQSDDDVADKPKVDYTTKEPVLDDDGEPVMNDRTYSRNDRARARQQREDISNLHFRLFGDYLRPRSEDKF